MAKTREQFIDERLKLLADSMSVLIKFSPDENDQGKMLPVYDVNQIISKMISLFVFAGLHVPITFAPSYNCVHADIEHWKKLIKEYEKEEGTKTDGTSQPE